MNTITLDELKTILKAQDVENPEHYQFICPSCKTVQTAQDLIDAGAGETFDEVQKYLAFSCIGRFTEDKGCDWTLGGLFQIHKVEVLFEDGTNRPIFEPVGYSGSAKTGVTKTGKLKTGVKYSRPDPILTVVIRLEVGMPKKKEVVVREFLFRGFEPCSDGHCVIKKPEGMRTNAGCGCILSMSRLQLGLLSSRLQVIVDEVVTV
ncbi:VVA0879 family protein [Endozoicomonas sp.]|uniref:VVA0879 family protein n=1 Tax=Endozoicomonas sp. TaxID=1892382 RepID=UPI00383B3AF7